MNFDIPLISDNNFQISQSVFIDGQTAHEPDIAMGKNGALWIVWSSRSRTGDTICARQLLPIENNHKITISSKTGIEVKPCMIALNNRTLRIVWSAFRDGKWQLLLCELFDGEPGQERVLAENSEGIFHPRIHLSADGTCYLVFEQVIDSRPRLFMMNEKDGAWSSPLALKTPEGACYRPCISDGPGGGVWLAYDVYNDGFYRVWLQRLDEKSSPIAVTNNEYQNLHASLTQGNDGELWIAWSGNQNEAFRDRWWMTKWGHLRRFDGENFSDPIGTQHGKDVYNEDSFQGWEFPEVTADAAGRVWLFGQSSHTLYAQYYAGDRWSQLFTIDQRRWGSWKPRCRVAGTDPMYLVSMGLNGAQLQRIKIEPAKEQLLVTHVSEPPPVVQRKIESRERPKIITSNGEQLSVFFGDLHAHCVYGDAANDVDEFYHRYRDAYGYDFATLTEHDFLDGMETSQSELKMMWNHSDRMTKPGEFVAFYGYEWTSPALADHAGDDRTVGEGHRHIIFRDSNGPFVSYGEANANTIAKLLARLKGEKALVIPHHTAWSGTDWDAHDEQLQRLIEVCSTHGRFEHSGNRPIGYRRDHIHPGKFVIDALARGYRFGFVGGSDSHGLKWHATELEGRAKHIAEGTYVGWKRDAFRSGMTTAILAPELTREALFDALYARRCYATSGAKIFVDFRVNDELMGSDIECERPPHLTATIKGTAGIRSIEIIRSGHIFAGLQSQPGESLTEMKFALDDKILIPGETHYYYLRVLQEDGNMAWSSPIWVRFRD